MSSTWRWTTTCGNRSRRVRGIYTAWCMHVTLSQLVGLLRWYVRASGLLLIHFDHITDCRNRWKSTSRAFLANVPESFASHNISCRWDNMTYQTHLSSSSIALDAKIFTTPNLHATTPSMAPTLVRASTISCSRCTPLCSLQKHNADTSPGSTDSASTQVRH